MPASPWKEPSWLASVEPAERTKALLRYHLAICALYATPEGTLRALSVEVGVPETSMSRWINNASIPATLCVTLEKLVGRDIMPRELLRPDLFHVEGQS